MREKRFALYQCTPLVYPVSNGSATWHMGRRVCWFGGVPIVA